MAQMGTVLYPLFQLLLISQCPLSTFDLKVLVTSSLSDEEIP